MISAANIKCNHSDWLDMKIEIHSPKNNNKIGEVEVNSPGDVKRIVTNARNAAYIWSKLDFKKRKEVLLDARSRIVKHREELIELLGNENGKPRTEALIEITYVCDVLTYYGKRAGKFLKSHRISPHLLKNKKVTTHYKPRGVVGMITPWNFPLILTIGESIPALAAGNAVVIKPSEWTPLIAMRGARILQETFKDHGLPAEIIQIINGYGETGSTLVDVVDMISFTGSVRTGRMVAERAASRLIPCCLELGGKDPMIILEDADLERATNATVWGAFSNAGQICISVERCYVENSIADQFIQRVVEKTKELRLGIDIGPMTFPKQIDIVKHHLADACSQGATILTGGGINGNYIEPTVITNVNHSMKIMTEETFGPVLPIMRVKDKEEALRLSNDSIYGLNASIFTRNKREGEKLAANVEAGITCVNDVLAGFGVTDAPSGGIKQSGIGKRHGVEGIRRFCREQVTVTDRFGFKREMFWYPYTEKTERLMSRILEWLY